jgi:hypothetical protein
LVAPAGSIGFASRSGLGRALGFAAFRADLGEVFSSFLYAKPLCIATFIISAITKPASLLTSFYDVGSIHH